MSGRGPRHRHQAGDEEVETAESPPGATLRRGRHRDEEAQHRQEHQRSLPHDDGGAEMGVQGAHNQMKVEHTAQGSAGGFGPLERHLQGGRKDREDPPGQ